MSNSDRSQSDGQGARDYADVVNRTQVASLRVVAATLPEGDHSTFGIVKAVSTGLGTDMLNEVYIFEEPTQPSAVEAVEWMTDRGVPYSVVVGRSVLNEAEPILNDLGFTQVGSEPGMVLDPLGDIPANESLADIGEAITVNEIEDAADVFSSVFGVSPAVSTRFFRSPGAIDGIDSRILLAEVNGEPAGCGICITYDDIVGVYGIGVREAFRRRGIGEALTWETIRVGRDHGGRIAMLLTTEMGYPLYTQMGFETVVHHHEFV